MGGGQGGKGARFDRAYPLLPTLRIDSDLRVRSIRSEELGCATRETYVVDHPSSELPEKAKLVFSIYIPKVAKAGELVIGSHGWRASKADPFISELALEFVEKTGATVVTPDWQNNQGLAYNEVSGTFAFNGNESMGIAQDFEWGLGLDQFAMVLAGLSFGRRSGIFPKDLGSAGVTLYGHSYGGVLSTDVAARSFDGFDPRFSELRVKEVFSISAPLQPADALRVVVAKVLTDAGRNDLLRSPDQIDKILASWRKKDAFPIPETALSGAVYPVDAEFSEYNLLSSIAKLRCPSHIYYGTSDDLVVRNVGFESNLVKLRAFPNCKVTAIPGAAHNLTQRFRTPLIGALVGNSLAVDSTPAHRFGEPLHSRWVPTPPIPKSAELPLSSINECLTLVGDVPFDAVVDFLRAHYFYGPIEASRGCNSLRSACDFVRDRFTAVPLLLRAAANVKLLGPVHRTDNEMILEPPFGMNLLTDDAIAFAFAEKIIEPLRARILENS